jgi:DNA-binding transcriptional MocR family regulator
MISIERGGKKKPIYLQLKEKIGELILKGILKAGMKLPSTRELAKELSINRNTVLAAYEELEAEGMVRSHVGQGTFVGNVFDSYRGEGAKEVFLERFNWSSHISLNYDEYTLYSMVQLYKIATASSYISFGGAIPDENLLSLGLIKRAFGVVIEEEGGRIFNYGPVEGYLPLREYIAKKMNDKGMGVLAKNIFITNGSQQALELSARMLIRSGDYVITEEPTYTGALSVFSILGAKIVGVPMQDDGLNIEVLEDRIKRFNPKLIYVIPNFHNPTGITMSYEKRRSFIEVVSKYNIPVIEDDVCGELRYERGEVPTLKALDRKGNVIYINSWSKVLVPAFRVGWAVIDDALREKFIAMKGFEDVTSNVVSQAIIHRFCTRGYFKAHLNRVRKNYRERRDVMIKALKEHFPSFVRYSKPDGGLVIWVSFPDDVDLNYVFEKSIRRGIIFCPGSLFYPSRKGNNEMRLGFAPNTPEKIIEGVSILGKILKTDLRSKRECEFINAYMPML